MKKAPKDVEKLMAEMNQFAFEVAATYRVKLDYSDASIRKVESILSEIHSVYKQTKDDDGLRGIALFFAAYIGEVIRKKGFGGTWSRHHPEVGEDSFPFHWNGADLFPYGWCLKRIFDGKQDNIWSKYQVCVLDMLKK